MAPPRGGLTGLPARCRWQRMLLAFAHVAVILAPRSSQRDAPQGGVADIVVAPDLGGMDAGLEGGERLTPGQQWWEFPTFPTMGRPLKSGSVAGLKCGRISYALRTSWPS